MEHITVVNLELKFPYMTGTLKNGEKRRVDIIEVVKEFEGYKYAYPHMKKLLNEEFFNIGKLCGPWSICWDDMTDLDTYVFEDAEVID